MPAPGVYDLTGEEARRGGEWLTGIARVMQARFSENALPLVTPYLDIVRAFNPQGDLKAYPGSPLIARALLRPQDRLTACEIEPNARKQLIDALRRDTQARVVDLDGWTALPAFVPPNERRGLVLIDPPFEQKDEFERLADGFARSLREMADRQLSALVPGQEPARHRQPCAPCRRGGRRQQAGRANACGWNSASRRRAPGGRPHLHRAPDRQSAVDAGRRTQDDPARTGKAARPGRRRPVQARDAQTLNAGRRVAGHGKVRLSRRQFAGNRIMLSRWDWLYVPLPRMVAAE